MITLYRAPFSTNVERVALALAHKGLEVESVLIDYGDRSPVIEVSGQPLVPVIVDGGEVIADSTRILRHLEARYPDPPIFPSQPAARAQMDVFLEWFNEVWKSPPNQIEAELAQPEPDGEQIAALHTRMRDWLDLFEELLDGREHLFGELSAADFAAFGEAAGSAGCARFGFPSSSSPPCAIPGTTSSSTASSRSICASRAAMLAWPPGSSGWTGSQGRNRSLRSRPSRLLRARR